MTGKVYLVGAGPGDPGLLTLKGKAAIERADAVIYDSLANPELLRYARPDCERIPVGKRAGHPTISQDKINRLLVRKARAGRTVVRLKGGDPFIFGRGGEEARALAQAGIPFEVVPGVTSGYAAPAYAGIPVTHRGLASSVTFITGHEGVKNGIRWKELAASADTLVLFMGVANLSVIARTLIRHGRSPRTPAAVIRWGSRAKQEVVVGVLSNIAAQAKGLRPPALAIIGEVVRLRRELGWFEKMPLNGKRIVVTRAREQASDLSQLLEDLGAEVIELPVIEIRKPHSWRGLDRAIARLESFNYVVFTSANGVRKFLDRLAASGRDARSLSGLSVGAIGPATSAELAMAGIATDFMPRDYRAEGLVKALASQDVRGKAFLIPRAKVARDLLPKALGARGARVAVVEAYQTGLPRMSAADRARLLGSPADAVTFTSSSTVTNFLRLFPSAGGRRWLRRAALVSIGPITSGTLRNAGLKVATEASESTLAGLVEAVKSYFASRR